MDIKTAAEREVNRIKSIVPSVTQLKPQGRDLIDFAKNYASDAEFFLKKGKLVEAFEAAIIAWAYIDVGLKLGFLSVPDNLKEHFTA